MGGEEARGTPASDPEAGGTRRPCLRPQLPVQGEGVATLALGLWVRLCLPARAFNGMNGAGQDSIVGLGDGERDRAGSYTLCRVWSYVACPIRKPRRGSCPVPLIPFGALFLAQDPCGNGKAMPPVPFSRIGRSSPAYP